MGICFSSKRSKTEVASETTIRVVHMDGTLQDFEYPTTVNQVMSYFPMHYLCNPVEIFQSGLVPLQLNHQLKTGQIYFILPNSTLKFNTSPDDLSILTRKLMNIAKTGRSPSGKSVSRSPLASPLRSPHVTSQSKFLDRDCGDSRSPLASPLRSPHGTSQSKFLDRDCGDSRSPLASPLRSPHGTSQSKFLDRQCGGDNGMLSSPRSPMWKPVMDTIIES